MLLGVGGVLFFEGFLCFLCDVVFESSDLLFQLLGVGEDFLFLFGVVGVGVDGVG